jgi:hypothetical protein
MVVKQGTTEEGYAVALQHLSDMVRVCYPNPNVQWWNRTLVGSPSVSPTLKVSRVRSMRKDLGPLWAWLPEGALHHDPMPISSQRWGDTGMQEWHMYERYQKRHRPFSQEQPYARSSGV